MASRLLARLQIPAGEGEFSKTERRAWQASTPQLQGPAGTTWRPAHSTAPERFFLLNWLPGFPNCTGGLTGNLRHPRALGSEGNPGVRLHVTPSSPRGRCGETAREMRNPQDTSPSKAAGTPSLSPNPGLPALTSPSPDPDLGFLLPASDQFLKADPKASLGFPRALRLSSAPQPDTP